MTLWLSPELMARLAQASSLTGDSRTEIIEKAIEKYLLENLSDVQDNH